VPTWGELLVELSTLQGGQGAPPPSPFDVLRRKYLGELREKTGRETILYYSGWLDASAAVAPPETLSVNPADVAGFMEACAGSDSRSLDLVIHSPGGDPDAAEQISAYLRTQYDHVRAIVPLSAMSAATMMALSADEIVMGAHSQLGPIDPQFTVPMPEGPRTASAQAIKDQFELAREQCQDPQNLPAWTPILRTYAPGLLAACDHASERAKQIVAGAMKTYMFAAHDDPEGEAAAAAEWFGNASEFLSHGRPVRRDEAREHGIEILDLEDDADLQDKVLSVHHAVMHTLSQTPTVKLIENDRGRAWLLMGAQQQIILPPGLLPPGIIPGQGEPGAPPPTPPAATPG